MMQKGKRKCVTIYLAVTAVLMCYLLQTTNCQRLRKTDRGEGQNAANSADTTAVQEGRIFFGRVKDGTRKSTNTSGEDESGYQADFTGWYGGQMQDDSTEASWKLMSPSLQCGGDQMKFRAMGPGASQFSVEQENTHPVPLSEIPPSCGYNMQKNPFGLVMKVSYDGCNMVQEGDYYILPMLWQGNPVSLWCPKSEAPTSSNHPVPPLPQHPPSYPLLAPQHLPTYPWDPPSLPQQPQHPLSFPQQPQHQPPFPQQPQHPPPFPQQPQHPPPFPQQPQHPLPFPQQPQQPQHLLPFPQQPQHPQHLPSFPQPQQPQHPPPSQHPLQPHLPVKTGKKTPSAPNASKSAGTAHPPKFPYPYLPPYNPFPWPYPGPKQPTVAPTATTQAPTTTPMTKPTTKPSKPQPPFVPFYPPFFLYPPFYPPLPPQPTSKPTTKPTTTAKTNAPPLRPQPHYHPHFHYPYLPYRSYDLPIPLPRG